MATILVVDDERAIRTLATAILQSAGHRVLTAANGLEGVAVFRSYPDDIGLVLTDMMMPVMDGAQAIERIRETRPHVPIILMSGYLGKTPPKGVVLFQKPFQPAALISLVSGLLGS
jgi:CheY-like chemotaxis protein